MENSGCFNNNSFSPQQVVMLAWTEEAKYPKTKIQKQRIMAEEGKADEQLFQLLSNLLHQVSFFPFSLSFSHHNMIL